jgi:hypothetical protein
MATVINFLIDQGTKFEGVATIQNEDGSIFDLTNYVPYAEMKRSYYTSASITIQVSVYGNPADGNIQLILLPSDTNNIAPGRYVYDVEVHNPNDVTDVKRVLQGVITVDPQVTKTP